MDDVGELKRTIDSLKKERDDLKAQLRQATVELAVLRGQVQRAISILTPSIATHTPAHGTASQGSSRINEQLLLSHDRSFSSGEIGPASLQRTPSTGNQPIAKTASIESFSMFTEVSKPVTRPPRRALRPTLTTLIRRSSIDTPTAPSLSRRLSDQKGQESIKKVSDVPLSPGVAAGISGSPQMTGSGAVRQQSSGEVVPGSASELLSAFPAFKGFPQTVLNELAAKGKPLSAGCGDFIVKFGTLAKEMYFVVEGQVGIQSQKGNSIGSLGEDEFFGELGLVNQTRTANIVAKTNCQLLVLTRESIDQVLAPHPDLKKQVVDKIDEKLSWLKNQETTNAFSKEFGGEFLADLARKDLGKLLVLSEVEPTFIEQLVMTIVPEVYDPGKNVINIGDESDAIFFLLKGSVEVIGPQGAVHAVMVEGAFFGEVGLFHNIKRTASIRAKEQCLVLKMMKSSLEQVLTLYPEVKKQIARVAAERYSLLKERGETGESREQFDVEISLQALKQIEIFLHVQDEVLSELGMWMNRRSWKSGDYILRCGEHGDSMHFLAAGNVDVLSEFGQTIDTASGPNAYFGEVAILEEVPRTASVLAKSDCSTYELRKEDVLRMISKYPQIGESIAEIAKSRMQAYLMRSILA
ncbi:cyclic nucleotide-binding-like protein [Polychytrium aggregatum]|uniref:cyclic nucleotide-binding-like protein n=1 Tax=Polychytrium aggregatum TaxID=110093 RepID=UPI0022FE5434|nr:cyclic nucleotide-binding-like protein [Polychytrium aggregatum]KAI9193148.1 cyclic nucleotide-binding-like protein [Polychytrium aggregatum]